MLRAHKFLAHKEIVFRDLRTFNIDINTADLVSRFLQSNIDIPDAIKRMEERAIEEKYYTDFLKKYVSEEYDVQEEYSFVVIALLHYHVMNEVSLDDAITELLTLSSKKTICIRCCSTGKDVFEKTKIVKYHNYTVLTQEIDTDNVVSEEEILSDASNSTNDPNYKPEESNDDSENTSDEEANITKAREQKGFNPFDSSDEENEYDNLHALNSTVSYNPYEDDSDSGNDQVLRIEASSMKKRIECQYCKKVFSNRYNMKLHLIGLVISNRILVNTVFK